MLTEKDLASYRAEFPIAERYAHLNHASFSPYSNRVADALRQHIEDMRTIPFDRLRPTIMALIDEVKRR